MPSHASAIMTVKMRVWLRIPAVIMLWSQWIVGVKGSHGFYVFLRRRGYCVTVNLRRKQSNQRILQIQRV